MNQISFNGKLVSAADPVFLVTNRSYRYGDGLFETMKMQNGMISLSAFHFERLFNSLNLLKFIIPKLFTKEKLEQEIIQLCRKNECDKLARIRLSVFRGNGGLYDEEKALQYVIESWPLSNSINSLNENGLLIDVFPDAEKSCDKFSNLKSANFLPYSMAALYAKENKLNDCLVFNSSGCIADSTIANVFLVKGDTICTPSLDEACVNGVMRRMLLEKLREKSESWIVEERAISLSDLRAADEIFLTNAINGIRWVKQFRDKIYINQKTTEIYNRLMKTFLT
jgi:branched-chain amino acid aminotransferase